MFFLDKSKSSDDFSNKDLDQLLLTECIIKSSCEDGDDTNKNHNVNFESSHEIHKKLDSNSNNSTILLEKENGDIMSIQVNNSKENK